jgi:hypothetical protein
MNFRHFLPVLAVAVATVLPASADETRTKVVKFERGKSSTVITDKITGRESVVFKLNARDKQFLKVSLRPDNESADFNIYIPGRGPGDEALFTSATGGREYTGQLYKTGDHSISVFLNRAAARRGETAKFDLVISVTDKPPVQEEEKPATGAVPQKVIDDCLKALRENVGHETGMKVIEAKRGENSYIIDVRVDSAEKPWRCYHDGTKCTGTEYQGEG